MLGDVARYLDHLTAQGRLSENSLAAYRRDLGLYDTYLRQAGLASAGVADAEVVAGFVEWIERQRSAAGRPFAASTVARTLVAVRGLHRFLATQGLAGADPSAAVRGSRDDRAGAEGRAGRQHLTRAEVGRLLAAPTGTDPAALRDRSLLELLYAAGLRISELVDLDVADLLVDPGTLVVARRTQRPREVPVGRPAVAAAQAWLARGRPALRPSTDALYCNLRGGRLTRQGAWKVVSRSGDRAGLDVSPNALRSAAAAHLVDGGAPPGVVAAFLGQAGSPRRSGDWRSCLRAAYDRAHPRSGSAAHSPGGDRTASSPAARGCQDRSHTMNADLQTRLRKELETDRESVVDELRGYGADPDSERVAKPDVDSGFADSAQASAERAALLALVEAARERLTSIDTALAAMDAGSYGVCEVCGEQIPEARMEARPMSVRCVDHA